MFGITLLRKPKNLDIKKKVVELRVAGWLGRYMSNRDWAGQTTPFPFFVLILYWIGPSILEVDPLVRYHEWVHVAQDQRDGFFLVSWFKYTWELLRERFINSSWMEAYQHNKYEIEAYAKEDAVADGTVSMPDWVK